MSGKLNPFRKKSKQVDIEDDRISIKYAEELPSERAPMVRSEPKHAKKASVDNPQDRYLPRCPKCGWAVGYHDEECSNCGLALGLRR